MAAPSPPVVLFGYESSPFTWKVRLVLKLKQIPYTYVVVPSMMPRPALRENFHVTYRKIPICVIGREVYCDTSLIIEAIEHTSLGHRSIYPPSLDGRTYRPLIRGFASYWTDRPFFRVTTGLIPASVWRTRFGTDRAGLIGHKLDPDKLEAKVPHNLSNLDLHLSILEPQFPTNSPPWIFSAPQPSLADLSLFYQLHWGSEIAAGRGISNLTDAGTPDTNTSGTSMVFNTARYPHLHKWYTTLGEYLDALPEVETKRRVDEAVTLLNAYQPGKSEGQCLPTPAPALKELDERNGLRPGVTVHVAPDDTGRDDPTLGTLISLSPEEIVIKPRELERPAAVDVSVHFPRLGFMVRPVKDGRAKL